MKKQFDSVTEARKHMFNFRRYGFDAFCKGRWCIVNNKAAENLVAIIGEGWVQL